MESGSQETIRLDKWLWFARFFKTRSLASKMCKAHKIRIDGQLISKASIAVRAGNILTFSRADQVVIIKIRAIGERRGPYSEACELYEDLSPPAEPKNRPFKGQVLTRDPGAGRPTKKDRRALSKLTNERFDPDT